MLLRSRATPAGYGGPCGSLVGIAVFALYPCLCSAFTTPLMPRWAHLRENSFACKREAFEGANVFRARSLVLRTETMGTEGGGGELTKEEKFQKYQQLFKELMVKAQKLPPGSVSKRAYMTKARNAKAMADALAYNKDKPEAEAKKRAPRTDFSIKPATAEMAAELTSIINDAYRGKEDGSKGWTTEDEILSGRRTTEEELSAVIQRSLLGTEGESLLAAVIDGRPIGCVRVEKTSEIEAEIGMFAVDIDLQSQGIGRALFNKAEEQAKSMGAYMAVMQVITAREDILKWYLSLGYTATGIRAEFPESELWEVKGDRKLFFERIEKTLD